MKAEGLASLVVGEQVGPPHPGGPQVLTQPLGQLRDRHVHDAPPAVGLLFHGRHQGRAALDRTPDPAPLARWSGDGAEARPVSERKPAAHRPCARVGPMAPRDDDKAPEPATDGEPIDPEDAAAVSAALDYVESGGELEDGEAWLARWRERLDAKWRARTG
ncbi:MAG TPA: hypothetical protein VFS43_35820 [Polyangiaceae bacterium]|nr:hypothetical protein [Polyangiaceae bacterium]